MKVIFFSDNFQALVLSSRSLPPSTSHLALALTLGQFLLCLQTAHQSPGVKKKEICFNNCRTNAFAAVRTSRKALWSSPVPCNQTSRCSVLHQLRLRPETSQSGVVHNLRRCPQLKGQRNGIVLKNRPGRKKTLYVLNTYKAMNLQNNRHYENHHRLYPEFKN